MKNSQEALGILRDPKDLDSVSPQVVGAAGRGVATGRSRRPPACWTRVCSSLLATCETANPNLMMVLIVIVIVTVTVTVIAIVTVTVVGVGVAKPSGPIAGSSLWGVRAPGRNGLVEGLSSSDSLRKTRELAGALLEPAAALLEMSLFGW